MQSSGHLFFTGSASMVHVPPREFSPKRVAPVQVTREAEGFFIWLFRQVGLDATLYRPTALMRRLPACLRLLRVGTVQAAREALAREPHLVGRVVSTVLLGVTQFYRDRAVFEKLRLDVLPELFERRGRIRVWSAACSDGQELYSIAILLKQARRLSRAELLGTDCRPEAIRRAAEARFAEDLVRLRRSGAHPRRLAPASRCQFQLSTQLRAAVGWRVEDVFEGAAAGPWDLILWRNMAIYLQPTAAEQVWFSLARELRSGGYLVVGKADHPPRHLGLLRVAPCVYRKPEALDG